ncbi:MAG: hypothetical protein ACF8R7_12060 [Phycisphaerales bacterium JB039]
MRGDVYDGLPRASGGLAWPSKLGIAAAVNIACFVGLWALARSLGYDPIGAWRRSGALPQSPIERLALVALGVLWLAINVRYLLDSRGGSRMLGAAAIAIVIMIAIIFGAGYILLQWLGGSLPW